MSEVQNPRSLAPGNVVAGKLRIIRRLGEGGMGAVFEVEHELTHHRRALKLLHSDMALMPAVVERFLREASAAGRIGNPHIVETFDAGVLDTGEPYIVMELLHGKSLAEVLQETGPLDVNRTCELLIQACDAMQSAHAVGIVHRDIKPENLFLSEPECSFVKVLDFGISKFDESKTGVEGLTMEGSPIGTPYYMSPEQIRGQKDVDARTDVYALGVVFYECVTGVRPFESDHLLQLIHLVSEGKHKAPSQVRPNLPREVDAVVAKAMAHERANRYASAGEFSLALRQLRDAAYPAPLEITAPVVTERPPLPERGTLAMTPEPMSRTLGGTKQSAWPHKSTLRWLVVMGAAVILLIGATVAFGPRLLRSTGGVPATASATQTPIAVPVSTPAARVTELALQAEATLPSATGSVEPSAPQSPPSAPLRRTDAPLVGKKAAPAQSARVRSDSYGLSKDNPFKQVDH